jgi:hypothetical protein
MAAAFALAPLDEGKEKQQSSQIKGFFDRFVR